MTEEKRTKIATVTYADSTGETSTEPTADTVEMRVSIYGGSPLVIRQEDLDESILPRLAWHGLKQKTSDEFSDRKKAERDAVAEGIAFDSHAYCTECVEDVWENLKAGVWSKKRAGGGRAARITDLILAVQRVAEKQGFPVPATDALRSQFKDDDVKKQFEENPAVKAEMLDIRMARMAEKQKELAAQGVGNLFESLQSA